MPFFSPSAAAASAELTVTAGITASTTQTQAGGTALTSQLNEVSTVGSADDTVTLITAAAGIECLVVNNGGNRLKVFPASGDNLGAGANTALAVGIAVGESVRFVAYDATNWEVVHLAFDATVPTTSALAASAAAGSAATAARRDHTHGRESFATPGLTLGTSNGAGSATTPIRSDATLLAFDATVPTTSALAASAAAGSATVAARRDHTHGRESFATNALVLGTAAAAGDTTTPLRSNDTIAAFDTTVPVTQAHSDAAAAGSATVAARRDHKHGMPAYGIDAVVDVAGGAEYTVLQTADDALDAGAYSLWVKQGTYDAGMTVSTNEVYIFFEPGTVIEAALVFSGADIYAEFGPDCDIQGTITMSGANWKLIMGAGCTTTGLIITGAGGLHDGGGFTTIHNGGTAAHGIEVDAAGDHVVIQNVACQTTAGGGSSYDALDCGGDSSVYQNVRIIDSDNYGIVISGVDSIVTNCEVLGSDSHNIYSNSQRIRVIGNRCSEAGGDGIHISGGGDNSLAVGNLIRNSTSNSIEIAAVGEDCCVVGNKLDGAVNDGSGTSTVASNEETAF